MARARKHRTPSRAPISARPSDTTGSHRTEQWLRRNTRVVLLFLLAASVAIRIIYFVQLNATPFVHMEQWRQSDMHYFDGWARQIAAGDWLSTSVQVPMHSWHRDVAKRYFAAHPEARAALRGDATGSGGQADADELLWSHWMRAPRFYQDPLYPYLIALTYRFIGADVRWVFAWQLALGAMSTLLVWQLARRYFGDVVGACAGLLAVACGPLVFYELMLLRDSTIVFASLAVIWLTDRAFSRPRWTRFALLGFTVALACVLKSTFVLFAVAILAATLFRFRRTVGELVATGGALAAGLAIGVAPLVARNVVVGVPPLSLASSGPLTLVASNELNYLPEVGFGINAPVLTHFLGETDRTWVSAAAEAMKDHTVASYASMLWRKWVRLWHWYEIPNNENFYYMRMQIPVLGWLPVTFWVCSPLALVGLALAWRQIREAWPLYLLVATSAMSMTVFYVLARFRLSLLAATIPFAALTIVQTVRWLRHRKYALALATGLSVVAVATWTSRPLAAHQSLIRMADWILPYSVYYQSAVYDALDENDWATAARLYLEFFRYEPDAAEILASRDPTLGPELADMHRECASILRMAGQPDLAQAHLEQAQRILRLSTFR